ncbi:hypothetical protein C5167_043919 [Papaver somniferum]|uniref:PRA1 family protein n=1 Tax=Papaver somniferum TaxID=3469 RepID=A0A4Y7L730_PAPSO|nr:hypothetical protein C5167_043919 [Papaver somniferum]
MWKPEQQTSGGYGTIPIPITKTAITAPTSDSRTEFVSLATERVQAVYASSRPWKELIDFSAFALPYSYAETTALFLIIFVGWFSLYFFRDEPVVVYNQTLDDRLVLFLLSLVTVVALPFTHVGMNVLVSCIIGAVVISLHAAIRITDDQFLDEQEVSDNGFASYMDYRLKRVVTGSEALAIYISKVLDSKRRNSQNRRKLQPSTPRGMTSPCERFTAAEVPVMNATTTAMVVENVNIKFSSVLSLTSSSFTRVITTLAKVDEDSKTG